MKGHALCVLNSGRSRRQRDVRGAGHSCRWSRRRTSVLSTSRATIPLLIPTGCGSAIGVDGSSVWLAIAVRITEHHDCAAFVLRHEQIAVLCKLHPADAGKILGIKADNETRGNLELNVGGFGYSAAEIGCCQTGCRQGVRARTLGEKNTCAAQ